MSISDFDLDQIIADTPIGRRILIVDDEPFIREILCRWLRSDGYLCDMAGDAEEALDTLAVQQFALVLSDINMPGRTGLELLADVRAKYPNTAVLMVTGLDDRETAIRTVMSGAYGYLVKPFDQNEVIVNVANALERRRLVLRSQEHQRILEQQVRLRTQDIRHREEEIALRLVAASEFRDNDTGMHIRRIGLYSALLAEACGWSQREVDDIRVAATMHDVGKIGVPDGILLKPGKLTAQEYEQMKLHTTIGAGILGDSDIPLLQMAREIAVTHHEKWDGSGYPRSLSGDAIPPCGRMVAIADVYDALVHRRVYKPAFSEEEAITTMTNEAGKHFDPKMLDTFFRILPGIRDIREQLSS